MPVDHYENFPVASWLLPARLRAPIEAIYGFARGADDIADEGDLSDAERLAGLDRYLRALEAIEAGRAPEAGFERIAQAVARYALPVALLRDLVDAFRQDVLKKRYATFAELTDYARRSANPVGRLLLHLFAQTGDGPRSPDGTRSAATGGNRGPSPIFESQSDRICSALQLINFWQDVPVDWAKGRVYIPREDLERFGVSEEAIARGAVDARWTALMAFECARARDMLLAGAPLGESLPGRIGLEIRATVAGGLAILDRIEAAGGDVFRRRPVLTKADWMRMIARAVARRGAGR
ncbi:MAG TPA: phytoene/squalene synthase family protein [Usitatibacter sp.]|nr:phytoene/squalene synthase family protein [Usitatibacter sp.]